MERFRRLHTPSIVFDSGVGRRLPLSVLRWRLSLFAIAILGIIVGCGETVVVILTPTPISTPTPWPTVYIPARHGPSPTPLPTFPPTDEGLNVSLYETTTLMEPFGYHLMQLNFADEVGYSLIKLVDSGIVALLVGGPKHNLTKIFITFPTTGIDTQSIEEIGLLLGTIVPGSSEWKHIFQSTMEGQSEAEAIALGTEGNTVHIKTFQNETYMQIILCVDPLECDS